MIEKLSFSMCVREKFGFLKEEFDYTIYAHLYGSEPWSDGTIEFVSPTTLIEIGKDRGSFWVLIRPAKEPDIAKKSLETIVASLSLMDESDFPPGPVAPAQYENTLEFYAQTLRKHCMSFIRGDFSLWTKVLRYHLNKMKREFGKKLPPKTYSDLENYIRSKERN